MKNKKITKLLIVSLLFVVSSCRSIYDSNDLPHLDGVVFEHLSSFTCDGINYSISLPQEDESFYLYKYSDHKTSSDVWTINYDYKIQYIIDDYLSDNISLFEQVYIQLNNNITTINELIGSGAAIYKYNETVIFEETVINELKGEISFMYYDRFLPIKLINLDEKYSYNIAIPISRNHLIFNDTMIKNPFEEGYINFPEFYNLPKSIENNLY